MERNAKTAERLGEKYKTAFYTSEEKMLSECECDAVYIATPVALHFKQAMIALSYGRHVLIEKPISMNAAEGSELVKEFKNSEKLLHAGYMMKYHNLHVKAKKLIDEGRIGKVNSVRLRFSCWYPEIEGAWRQNKEISGGGAFMDLGVHCVELIEHMLGEKIVKTKSFYSTKSFSYGVEDGAVTAFETESGVLGTIEANFNIPDAAACSKAEFYGDGGSIILSGTLGQEEKGNMELVLSPQDEYSAAQNSVKIKPVRFYGNGGDLYYKQIDEFVKAVKSGKADYSLAEKAVHVQKIVDGVYADK